MIPIRIKKHRFARYETIYLPSNYGELTLDQYLGYSRYAQDVATLAEYLSGCPYRLDSAAVAPYLAWLAEPIELDEFKMFVDLDIKRGTLAQKMEAHQKLQSDAGITGVGAVVSVYYPDQDPGKQLLADILPKYFAIADQLEEILTVEKNTLSTPPTPEQIRAGISEFEKLGNFNVIDDLAHGKPWRYEDVLALEYIVAYQRLLRMIISSNFAERYSEIMRSI